MASAHADNAEFLTAVYEIDGPESHARMTAERICADQTIEADQELLSASLRSRVLGRLERLQAVGHGRYQATIRFNGDVLGGDCSDVLNLLFGTSSLRGDVTLASFTMTDRLLSSWAGPRFGLDGIRQSVGISHRPLLCAVLKPLGRSAQELAALATQFVEGGVDLVKDDQSLVDQPWCSFEERSARCAEAIGRASVKRGRPCLYFVHVSGALDVMRRRVAQAKALGATGILVAPGLTGFDALRVLTMDDHLALPIASHPAMLGAFIDRGQGGLAPSVVYGLLPRLVGADLSIYPAFGSGYPISEDDCASVASSCQQAWIHIKPMMPAVGGRIGSERLPEIVSTIGTNSMSILGSRVQQHPKGVVAAIQAIHLSLEERYGKSG